VADTHGASNSAPIGEPLDPSYDLAKYVKRLMVERHAIRAALESPGGSIILAGTSTDLDALRTYSSVIGNDSHLDLIEAESAVNQLSVEQRMALLAWCDGMSPQQAALYVSRKTGSRKSTEGHAAYKRIDRAARRAAEGMAQ